MVFKKEQLYTLPEIATKTSLPLAMIVGWVEANQEDIGSLEAYELREACLITLGAFLDYNYKEALEIYSGYLLFKLQEEIQEEISHETVRKTGKTRTNNAKASKSKTRKRKDGNPKRVVRKS